MRGVVVGAVLCVMASVVQAGILAPRKASDLVVVEANLGSESCSAGVLFDTRMRPDGSEEPFEIPNKAALVVTNIDVLGFGGVAGDNNQLRIFTGLDPILNLVVRREQAFSADGRVFYVIELDPGIVVPSGAVVCMNNSDNATLTGTLRGYLTKNR